MSAIDTVGTNPVDAPAVRFGAVTPDVPLEYLSRALYVGGAGDVRVESQSGDVATFAAVPAGSVLPIRVRLVVGAGTTATDIVALW